MNERQERLVRAELEKHRRDHFAPGFADRVATRWQASRAAEPSLDAIVVRQFKWMLPFAIAATLLLAVQNVMHRERAAGQTVVESLIGLKPVQSRPLTIEAMYGLGIPTPSIQE